jgi:hypothetical protein
MLEAVLIRQYEEEGATRGTIYFPDIGLFHTLEEPWKDNQPQISCIPVGRYEMVPHGWEKNSKRHIKNVWQCLPVPGRKGILIHIGNTTLDIEGCILVGKAIGRYKGLPAVLSSGSVISLLRKRIGAKSWYLTIKNKESKNEVQ